MALLDAQAKDSPRSGAPLAEAPHANALTRGAPAETTGPGVLRDPRFAVAAAELLTVAAVLAAAVFISARLDVWSEKGGLDFSVYWHGGKVLHEAGLGPSGLY